MSTYKVVVVDERPILNVSDVGIQGAQGPVGDTKVFVQGTDPAVENNWGLTDAGKVWIQYG